MVYLKLVTTTINILELGEVIMKKVVEDYSLLNSIIINKDSFALQSFSDCTTNS